MIKKLFCSSAGFGLLCLVFLSACVVQRTVVQQPKLSLHLTDGAAPLARASVYLYWVSNPYSRLEEVQTFTTDIGGNLGLEEILQNDIAYPLALHGVTYYQHKLCLEAQGYRSLLITLVALPGDDIHLDVPLTPGERLDLCSSYERLERHQYSAVPRADIESQHESIRGAYEVTN
jgi:hypothetical protein